MSQPDPPFHARTAPDVLASLDVDPGQGLAAGELRRRQAEHGPNRLREAKRRSAAAILADQFKSIVVVLLIVAAAAAFGFGKAAEGIAILAVILINGAIGFASEWRALKSMKALRRMGAPRVRVRRDGSDRSVEVESLVPGDIVLQEGGDIVPADLRLIEANQLRVEEAVLTGESVPARKALDPVAAGAPVAERASMLFKGTTIAEGSALAVVAATGMDTELGQISRMVEEAESEATPLERRLDRLGRRLAWITVAVAVMVAIAGLLAGQPPVTMIETAIALGVAAIPEGLPIVATIALARGMWLMARRQALINRLAAVETLGATHIICTDKTGTLTESRMTLVRAVTAGGEHRLERGPDRAAEDATLRRLIEAGVLCNNASLDGDAGHGDPTEIALLRAGEDRGLIRQELTRRTPELREVPFSSEAMMMATFHRAEDGVEVAVKGAPRAVLRHCERIASGSGGDAPLDGGLRRDWEARGEALAREGLRVLAMADKRVDSADAEPYSALRFLGLVGLLDPPRSDVKGAIGSCRQAGVRVVMVTGDQPATAGAIARQSGLVDQDDPAVLRGSEMKAPADMGGDERRRALATRVFARFSPRQKLHLVQLFQDDGQVVAMTGDGVNDTPALKKADIGIAMGRRGTDAARQVADMVLKDDAFSTIVAAVRHGRIIFGNIRKSVMFMLCTNVAEIIAVALASLASVPIPLLPLQILYLNIITDAWPALALGTGKGDPAVMKHPPRPASEQVLTRGHWLAIGGWSALVAACVLGALAAAISWLDMSEPQAVTVSFLTLAFAKLWFVFNLRDPGSGFIRNDIVLNPWVWGAIGLCIVLMIAAVYLPGLAELLRTEPPSAAGWGLVLAASALPWAAGQGLRAVQRGRTEPLSSAAERA